MSHVQLSLPSSSQHRGRGRGRGLTHQNGAKGVHALAERLDHGGSQLERGDPREQADDGVVDRALDAPDPVGERLHDGHHAAEAGVGLGGVQATGAGVAGAAGRTARDEAIELVDPLGDG